MCKTTRLVLAFFLVLATATVSAAQEPFKSPKPDNRYKGYPSSLVAWPKSAPTAAELAACAAQKPYEPRDTHLTKYVNRLQIAHVRVQQTDECVYMRVAGGDHWVLRVKGTKVGQDELYRDLVDLGSPTGQVCDNSRAISVPVNVPAAPPTPVITPVPVVVAPPAPKDVCPNIEGLQTTIPNGMVMNNGECLAPVQKTETPAPQAPHVAAFEPAPSRLSFTPSTGLVVTFGIGYTFGNVHSDYSDPVPDRGDVPQRHGFSTVVPILRVDQSADHGVFGSVSAGILGKTSGMEFQDANGSWSDKKRDSDTSKDNTLKVKGGYKFAIADNVSVGGFGGWSKLCLCEKYEAQGATTTTQRSYQGLVLGGELSGATKSQDHRITVNVTGEIGPSQTRKSWTHQTFPGVTFARVDHPNEKAKAFGIRAEADVQVYKFVHANVAYDYLGLSSTRPSTFTAHERVNVTGLTIGISIKWAR